MLVPVQFLRKNPPYMAGDVAGFPAEYAARLVKAGRAAYLQDGHNGQQEGKEGRSKQVKEDSATAAGSGKEARAEKVRK